MKSPLLVLPKPSVAQHGGGPGMQPTSLLTTSKQGTHIVTDGKIRSTVCSW